MVSVAVLSTPHSLTSLTGTFRATAPPCMFLCPPHRYSPAARLETRSGERDYPLRIVMDFVLDAKGQGPIATVLKTGEPLLIDDIKSSKLQRRELAIKYGVNEVAFAPFEDGVVEFGTTALSPIQWGDTMPQVPTLPKEAMRAAFEELGALYVLYWAPDGNVFRVVADYEVPSSINARLRRRSDGASFISNSKPLALPVDGSGPVATARKTGKEQAVACVDYVVHAWVYVRVMYVRGAGGVLRYRPA